MTTIKKTHEFRCTKKVNIKCKNCTQVFSTVTLLEEHNKKIVLNKQKRSLDVKHVLNILLLSMVYRDIPITVMVKLNVESVKRYFHLYLI